MDRGAWQVQYMWLQRVRHNWVLSTGVTVLSPLSRAAFPVWPVELKGQPQCLGSLPDVLTWTGTVFYEGTQERCAHLLSGGLRRLVWCNIQDALKPTQPLQVELPGHMTQEPCDSRIFSTGLSLFFCSLWSQKGMPHSRASASELEGECMTDILYLMPHPKIAGIDHDKGHFGEGTHSLSRGNKHCLHQHFT